MSQVTIEVIRGVEGPCIAINDYRVAGPKPWGGGTVVQSWKSDVESILHALGLEERKITAANKRFTARKPRPKSPKATS